MTSSKSPSTHCLGSHAGVICLLEFGPFGKGSCGGLGASWTVLRRLESALRADEKIWRALGSARWPAWGGRLVVQGGQRLRQYGSGVVIPSLGGSLKTTKPVCRKLQPTTYQYKLPNTMTLRTTKTTDFRMQRLQTCQPTNLLKYSSQPGGPQGAGGYILIA